MGILAAIKRFPSAVIAGFSSFGRRAFHSSGKMPLQNPAMADYCATCGIPLRIGSQSSYCSEHGGGIVASPSVQPPTPTAPSAEPAPSATRVEPLQPESKASLTPPSPPERPPSRIQPWVLEQQREMQRLKEENRKNAEEKRKREEVEKRKSEEEKWKAEKEKRSKDFFEATLSLSQLIGQSECIERLKRFGEFYAARTQVPEHVLIAGGDGMGKRMFARAFAKAFNTFIQETIAEEFERIGDMTACLTSLDQNEALVILNIQDLRKPIAEILQVALQDFRIDLVIGQGPAARVHPFDLNRFTCIATAPRVGDIAPDLLRCFSLSLTVQPYSNQELKDITARLASHVGLTLNEEVIPMLVNASDRTPRSIDQMLKRFNRFGKPTITEVDAAEALAAFGLAPQQQKVVTNSNDLDGLSGVEFEKLITSLLGSMGFQAEMTRATGDGGIDIVAQLDRPILGGRYLIQCKRFAAPVGAPTVREFYGAVVADRKAVKGILITTAGFTDQAREFAENLPIEFIDRRRLDVLLADSQPQS
jgi:Holliday junction resolvasome RuvABC ATP-dependent DNA helicase subunit